MLQTTWDRRHLLALEGLPREDLVMLLDRAERYVPMARPEQGSLDTLQGRIVANLFFEDSTRTRCSFSVAVARLGAVSIDLAGAGSSRSKGETLLDTALTVEAMGVDALVVRTAVSGGAALVADGVKCHVINAGDGRHEHPTQGLLDLLTLRQRLGDLTDRTVAIVGDIAASRVARSNLHALTTMGANVVLVGPPSLVPQSLLAAIASDASVPSGRPVISHDLDPILRTVDAIMMLRVQFERGSRVAADYHLLYGLTTDRAARLRPGVPVLHPGPMNRGTEIDSEVADDPDRSVIRQQVSNGVAVRMAVLDTILS